MISMPAQRSSTWPSEDLDAHIDELKQRGLKPGEIVDANKGVRLSALDDPDGNKVWLIGGFRVVY